MGLRVSALCPATVGFALLLLLSALTGCQGTPSVSATRLIAHQALLDFSGLRAPQSLPSLNIAASIPSHWEAMPVQQHFIYVHEQWRSPSHNTGVGVAYIHLPLPMSAKTIIWFAKTQYASQKNVDTTQGRLIGQWTDTLGREWFEAEDNRYHVKGYAITNGFDAWIVYSGYRWHHGMNMPEIATAARSMESILPAPIIAHLSHAALADSRP